MAIHIVTDSTACLPKGYVEEHGVTVVSLKVSLDGKYFRDVDAATEILGVLWRAQKQAPHSPAPRISSRSTPGC